MRRAILLTLILMAVTAGRAHWLSAENLPTTVSRLAMFPLALGEWRGQEAAPIDFGVLQVLAASDYLNRIYRTESSVPVAVYVGYYRSQKQGAAIHSPMNCLPGAGWQPVETQRMELVPTAPGFVGPVTVNRVVIQKGEERQLVLYWYQSRSRVVASEYWSKIYLVTDAFASRRTDAALVRVVAPIDSRSTDGETRAATHALAFARAALPQVRDILFGD